MRWAINVVASVAMWIWAINDLLLNRQTTNQVPITGLAVFLLLRISLVEGSSRVQQMLRNAAAVPISTALVWMYVVTFFANAQHAKSFAMVGAALLTHLFITTGQDRPCPSPVLTSANIVAIGSLALAQFLLGVTTWTIHIEVIATLGLLAPVLVLSLLGPPSVFVRAANADTKSANGQLS